jgi:protein tyrosine/serine phosphatase
LDNDVKKKAQELYLDWQSDYYNNYKYKAWEDFVNKNILNTDKKSDLKDDDLDYDDLNYDSKQYNNKDNDPENWSELGYQDTTKNSRFGNYDFNKFDDDYRYNNWKLQSKKKEKSNYIRFSNGSILYMSNSPYGNKDAKEVSKYYLSLGVTTVVVLLDRDEIIRNKNPKAININSLIKYKFDNPRPLDLFSIYQRNGLKVIHYPIEDYSVPKDMQSFDKLLNKIIIILKNKENILVHCEGGHGRTGLVVVGLLVKAGFDPAKAIARVCKARDVLDSYIQIKFITYYYNYLKRKRLINTKDLIK